MKPSRKSLGAALLFLTAGCLNYITGFSNYAETKKEEKLQESLPYIKHGQPIYLIACQETEFTYPDGRKEVPFGERVDEIGYAKEDRNKIFIRMYGPLVYKERYDMGSPAWTGYGWTRKEDFTERTSGCMEALEHMGEAVAYSMRNAAGDYCSRSDWTGFEKALEELDLAKKCPCFGEEIDQRYAQTAKSMDSCKEEALAEKKKEEIKKKSEEADYERCRQEMGTLEGLTGEFVRAAKKFDQMKEQLWEEKTFWENVWRTTTIPEKRDEVVSNLQSFATKYYQPAAQQFNIFLKEYVDRCGYNNLIILLEEQDLPHLLGGRD